ncbi:MAG: phenylalanine--tRNA ligase subunit beta [Candidatus Omnitrophica bacterium]|nr:phenylalanine--tRNA ligase subunit beta [Candidatus Omnitrophota bacterium]
MKVSLDWLNDYVDIKGLAPEELARRLTMAGLEVKAIEAHDEADDTVFEAEVTTNRPDWLSHIGIAREIGAILNKKINFPETENSHSREPGPSVSVDIIDEDYCPYYSACVLEDVRSGETPDFMKKRLAAVGIRPVNFIVDITNYVLLELGQPLHAFDLERLSGNKIIVRRAKPGETITAINDNKYDLTASGLVIADESKPIAVAGVMGGKDSEVQGDTKNILLESAFFSPVNVRITSRRLGLSSESSYRFERRVDPLGVDLGRERAIYLIREYGSIGKISPVFSSGEPPYKSTTITLDIKDVEKSLGVRVLAKQIASILKSLELTIKKQTAETLTVKAPSFRADLSRPVDLVEEIARIYGYDNIPDTLPHMEPIYAGEYPAFHAERIARECLVGSGFNEVMTFSLIDDKVYESCGYVVKDGHGKGIDHTFIKNPQHKELRLMRPSILPGLMQVIKHNMSQGIENIQVFEIGACYKGESQGSLPEEKDKLASAMTGVVDKNWQSKGREASLPELKGIVEVMLERLGITGFEFGEADYWFLEKGATVSVIKDKETLGVIGMCSRGILKYYDIDAAVIAAEFDMNALANTSSFERVFKPLPRYPSSRRDIALLASSDVKAGAILEYIRSFNSKLIRNAELFDLYKGGQVPPGKKSLAFSVEFQAEDRTLASDEIDGLYRKLVSGLQKTFQVTLR